MTAIYQATANVSPKGKVTGQQQPRKSELHDYAGVARGRRPHVEIEETGQWTHINVQGADPEHVAKALQDRIAQVRAEKMGIA